MNERLLPIGIQDFDDLRKRNCIYVDFELKMDKGMEAEAAAEEALKQIEEKGYATRFIVSGKTTHKIGVVFSSEGKGLVSWKEQDFR